MIRQDCHALDSHETLRTTWAIEQLILIQSVQGHAHEGHALFRGRRFPNTTMDDIVRALRLDPETIQEDRQGLINAIKTYVERTIAGDAPGSFVADGGAPLLGISTLRYIQADPKDVLRGMYLGGLRDDSDVRLEVEKERGIKIGGGRAYLVDFAKMRDMGLDGDDLAKGDWADDIGRFEKEGLIVGIDRRDEPDICYQYIRHRRGPGASDDTAIVAAGLLWGLGVAVGVFFADAIDTLEKYVPSYSDQDEEIALGIESSMKDIKMGRDEVKTLTFVAAVPEDQQDDVPDSSLRHLLGIDRNEDLCAMEAHFLTVQNIPTPTIGISHDEIPSHKFYDYVRGRVAAL